MKSRNVNFMSEPPNVSLACFRGFDFGKIASWSYVELYVAATGGEIDLNFVKASVVLSYYHPELYFALIDGIRSSNSLDAFVCTEEFAECAYKVWNDTRHPVVWYDIYTQINAYGLVDYDTRKDMTLETVKRRKYELLSILDARFPHTLIKFYAGRANDIYANDECFMLWLRRRIKARAQSDPAMARILRAMDADIRKMNRTAMFTA